MRRKLRRSAAVLAAAAVGWLVAERAVGTWNARRYRQRAAGRVQPRPPRTFYVAARGDDGADGSAPGRAWRTIARANRAALVPGDSLLLEGGATFAGTLVLDEDDVGAVARPITVASWGGGRATIAAGGGRGVLVHNTGGVRLTDLAVVGTSRDALDSAALAREPKRSADRTTAALPSGVVILNDLRGGVKIPGVDLARLDVAGFAGHGVLVDGGRWFSGFRGVRIADVAAHDNGVSGVSVLGEYPAPFAVAAGRVRFPYAHEDVVIERVAAYRNRGLPGRWRSNTGSGVVIAGVRGAVVRHSEAYENGAWCDSRQGGPVGIWAWDADRVVIEYNRSHHNRVAGAKDGGGFDLDGGVSHSVLRHNASWENDGAGYLLYQFGYARPHTRNVVRGNLSRDDGRRNGYGGVHVVGPVHDDRVEENTVEMGPAARDPARAIVVTPDPDAPELVGTASFTGNTVRVRGGVRAVVAEPGAGALRFRGNRYQSDSGALRFVWRGRPVDGEAAWRAAAGDESPAAARPVVARP